MPGGLWWAAGADDVGPVLASGPPGCRNTGLPRRFHLNNEPVSEEIVVLFVYILSVEIYLTKASLIFTAWALINGTS